MADAPSREQLADPDVVAMLHRNHKPQERWTLHRGVDQVLIQCRTCLRDWPCPTITAVRALDPIDPWASDG